MARRRKNSNYTIIISAAVILIIVAAAWGYLTILEEPQEEMIIEAYELSEEFYDGPDPVVRDLFAYSREGLSKNEINERLDGPFELLINEDDITADGHPEFVIIEKNPLHPTPHRSLQEDGYTQTIEGMIIYQRMAESMVPVFILTPEEIQDERGNILIGQVRADHGYVFQVYDHDDDEVYSQAVKLIDLVILDEQGRASSDDITVYWDPSTALYRATNTFGAPGTYAE
ncbi:MAG: hypothetical protein WD625_03995 [Balneolales bacterium]